MPLTFDASLGAVLQSGGWQCSAASTAWLLSALGFPATQDDIVNALGPNRIDSSVGLHDGSGAGLVDVLGGYGVSAMHGPVSFDDCLGQAAGGPMLIGSSGWNHWVAVRGVDGDTLLLANPAPGYRGVGQTLTRGQFDGFGGFYGVWPTDVATAAAADTSAPVDAVPATSSPSTAWGPPGWTIIVAGAVAAAWAFDLV